MTNGLAKSEITSLLLNLLETIVNEFLFKIVKYYVLKKIKSHNFKHILVSGMNYYFEIGISISW